MVVFHKFWDEQLEATRGLSHRKGLNILDSGDGQSKRRTLFVAVVGLVRVLHSGRSKHNLEEERKSFTMRSIDQSISRK